jgi:orotidine-5'-phosphate decarboxylase
MAAASTLITETKQDSMINAKERLIVALDVADTYEARAIVDQLDGVVDFFKVGLTLQLASGVEELIRSLIENKKRVFLDYKYYDIAETLKKAVARAANLGVSFLTVHGTSECIKGAMEGRGDKGLKLFVVTVLTSLDKADLIDMGYTNHTVEELVLFRATKALLAGCDGVIASGQEARSIKELSNKHGKPLLVVTPGIRPDGYPEDDQKRRTTPSEAILAGADYLVLGRPITQPEEYATSRDAAIAIVAEMQKAFDERT